MTKFTKEDVQYFANFVRIGISDADAETFAAQLADMISFSEVINEADTENTAPMTHPLPIYNVLRDDVPMDVLDRDDMLKSVEEHEDGLIKVPSIL